MRGRARVETPNYMLLECRRRRNIRRERLSQERRKNRGRPTLCRQRDAQRARCVRARARAMRQRARFIPKDRKCESPRA